MKRSTCGNTPAHRKPVAVRQLVQLVVYYLGLSCLGVPCPMRLHLLPPQVKPGALALPTACPTSDCPGSTFRLHQTVRKTVRDTRYTQVPAARYQCLLCHHTFRVYPVGVTAAHTSQRVRGLGVMF